MVSKFSPNAQYLSVIRVNISVGAYWDTLVNQEVAYFMVIKLFNRMKGLELAAGGNW